MNWEIAIFVQVNDNNFISLFLYGGDEFDNTKNWKMLMLSISFLERLIEV